MKTKLTAFIMVIAMLFSLTACSGAKSSSTSSAESATSSDSTASEVSSQTSSVSNTSASSSSVASTATITNSNTGAKATGRYATSGTVTVAFNIYRPTDVQPLFDSFNNYYPNIKLKVDYYNSASDNSQEYIATKSAAGTLPDVVFDDIANLPLYISEGLVYPLTDFVKNDTELSYVPSNLIKEYTYGGQLYALPHQAYFCSLIINTDALANLNMDLPALNWTMDDFAAFCKKATTSKYSAVESLDYLEYYGSGVFSGTNGLFGYNESTHSFNMMNSFASSLKLMRQLRQVPGLEAQSLRANSSGGVSDYQKKFGTSAEYGASKEGRTVIIDMQKGTYSSAWVKQNLTKIHYVYWPYPQLAGHAGRLPAHVDHAWMTTNAKNPKAAFEVLRYLTYSQEGNLVRLNAYTNAKNGSKQYKLNLSYFTPTTYDPKVVAAFKKLTSNDKVAWYMYSNLKNSFRADPDKFIPGFGQNWADVINTPGNRVVDGLKDADATCKDLQVKATAGLKVYWDDFYKKLASVQKTWKAAH